MKIAIIGAGCIGLSFALELKKHAGIDLYYSPKVPAASQMSAGLINPLAGMRANLAYCGWEALAVAVQLIQHVDSTVITHEGIFRPDVHARFRQSEGIWCTPEEASQFYPNPNQLPGIFIPKAIAINAEAYLSALKAICEKQGVRCIEGHIASYQQLQGYDRIVIAAGSGMKQLVGDALGTLNIVKGQTLSFATDKQISAALSGRSYLTIHNGILTIGATYEHFPKTTGVDIQEALSQIKPKIDEFWPGVIDSTPIAAHAGFRCTTPSSLPVFKEIEKGIFAIGGLGSKGLLYHAWLAKKLTSHILSELPILWEPDLAAMLPGISK